MYWKFSRFIKFLTFILRVIQILGFIYLLAYILYWFCAVARFTLSYYMSPFFELPQEITMNILYFFKVYINNDFSIFKPEIFISGIFTFLFLLLYNFIFIFIGNLERFFVEKSYEKGEKDYK